MTTTYRIQIKRGPAAEWTADDPVLAEGEFGLETDSLKLKIGDGISQWSALPYLIDALFTDAEKVALDILIAGQVVSIFGRTGIVTAEADDYTADQITDTASKVLMTPAERTKVANIEAIPGGGIAIGATDKLYLTVNADGFWITSNACWDGGAWQRIDISKWAFGFNIRTLQDIPYEAATGGAIFWKAAPGANPINATYGAVGGWQNGIIVTEFGDLVVGGHGIEVDGNGFLPYGRLVHYRSAGGQPEYTGLLTNLFLDFSDVDDDAKPSWFIGRKDDGVIIARAAAAAVGVGSLTDLLTLSAAGLLVATNLQASDGFLYLGSTGAAVSADASYLYLKDPAGANRLFFGKAGVDNRVIVDLQNDSDASFNVRNSSGVAKFTVDATGLVTAGSLPMARLSDTTAYAKTLLDDADATAARATLGLTAAYDHSLQGAYTNRIINGDMRVDQRYFGAAQLVDNTGKFVLDRWAVIAQGAAGNGTLGVQSFPLAVETGRTQFIYVQTPRTSPAAGDVYVVMQSIEGLDVSDLMFGNAWARPFTFSFVVRASHTGTYAIAFRNSATNRCYVTTYTVNQVNVSETKAITVPGDTTGTWLTNGGIGLSVIFDLGSGSTHETATLDQWQAADKFSVPGVVKLCRTADAWIHLYDVQLIPGSAALPFQRRPTGQEIALCQRFYEFGHDICGGYVVNGGWHSLTVPFRVLKRGTPTMVFGDLGNVGFAAGVPSLEEANYYLFRVAKVANSASAGGYYFFTWKADAEL